MSVKISDNTSIGLPLRNLIGLIGAIVIGAWFAFGVIERLNQYNCNSGLVDVNQNDKVGWNEFKNQIQMLN